MDPSSLCPTGVLPVLGVTAASWVYDLAVVEGGTLTHSSTGDQTNAQFRPTIKRHVCDPRVGGRFVIWEGGYGNSQNLRNFPSLSPGGGVGLAPVLI